MKQLKITSIAVMVLGGIHLIATPVIFSPLYGNIHTDLFLSYLYMFIITGIATFLVGWLQNFLINKSLKMREEQVIMDVCIAFMILLGGGAVSIMWENPFAYVALLIGLYQFVLFKRAKKTPELFIIN